MTEIILYTSINAPIQIVFDCARSIDIHQLSTAKTNEKAIAGRLSGLCELGDEVTWRAKHFGIYQTLSSKITKLKAPFYFQDCMVKGAFSFIKHDHYFEEKKGVTEMKDVFSYGVPYGIFGEFFNKIILNKYMIALLTERNRVIKEVAEKE
ncbi:cell division protein [Pedobacter polaris]|uniref:Cell division protein n=1 Tax=Pedobacter polaris TaxID=2571273 RepID=A0A4U1CRF2_9SPHI|nr:SRPBCC family protein [Pedobacter polaris]TKC10274.1 cell division protein [Pedobacter polaris]